MTLPSEESFSGLTLLMFSSIPLVLLLFLRIIFLHTLLLHMPLSNLISLSQEAAMTSIPGNPLKGTFRALPSTPVPYKRKKALDN